MLKAVSQNTEKSEDWSNAKQLLSKRLTSLVHCEKLVLDFYMTLGRNATTLPSSFIRKQWKQKVKTDHYPSPCIGQKTNRMGRKISNVSKVMIFTRSQARPNFPLESVLNNKLSRCVNARFTRWSLDNEDIVKTSQGCRQSIQKYCCGFTLDTTMVFYKSRSYIQR